VGERLQRLDAVTAELSGQLGRPPTDEELTEASGLTLAEREALEGVARVSASLDQPAAADSATSLGDLVAPDDEDWVGDVDQAMMRDRVRDAVERLPGLQRDVLRLRFGFGGDSPASLQATAEQLGVGVRRVRRAEEEALAALSADVDVMGAHLAA
jgi:RNA polymerase primary sigma factor